MENNIIKEGNTPEQFFAAWGNKKLMEYKLAATANMMSVLSDLSGGLALNIIEASEQFDKLTDTEHARGDLLSQMDLDN